MATTTTKAKRRRPAAAKEPASKTFRTIAAAAKELGVDERTLKSWSSKGCPWTRGAYDVVAIEDWRQKTLRPAGSKEIDEWETRRRAAVAQREELRLADQRGELIEVTVAVRIVKRHAAEVRLHLEQLPDFAASLVKMPAAKRKEFLQRIGSKVRELCASIERAENDLAAKAENE